MEHLREVAKIAEWGIKGDSTRVMAYLNQLIEKLQNSHNTKAAKRLQDILSSPSVTISGLPQPARLPVDGESRLSLADEETVNENDSPIKLNSHIQTKVNEFIKYVKNADELEAHGVGIAPSLLSYGPPGTGKTQLARHIASELHRPLITARADTLISSFLGSTSKNIRTLFDHVAHRHCVLFLDEIDAFAKLRDDHQELGELKRVVVSLLQNIDALNPNTVLLAATNHEHLLDPAIWRRFSFKLNLLPPEYNEREQLLKLFLGKYSGKADIKLIANITEGMTGADLRTISQDAIRNAVLSKRKSINELRFIWNIIETRTKRPINPNEATPENIHLVRDLSPEHFKNTLIAQLFNTSASTVSRKLKKG